MKNSPVIREAILVGTTSTRWQGFEETVRFTLQLKE